jgi:hypothetical protein
MQIHKFYGGLEIRDLILGGFVLIALFWLVVVRSEGVTSIDPLWTYYDNRGIQLIFLTALLIDLAILGSGVGKVVAIQWQNKVVAQRFSWTLSFLALAGAILTWLELWYGSTFYYGEVRDKQGLPFTINNGGPLGSFAFVTYVLWALPLANSRRVPALVTKGIATLILLLAHWLIFRLVEEPWRVWQS